MMMMMRLPSECTIDEWLADGESIIYAAVNRFYRGLNSYLRQLHGLHAELVQEAHIGAVEAYRKLEGGDNGKAKPSSVLYTYCQYSMRNFINNRKQCERAPFEFRARSVGKIANIKKAQETYRRRHDAGMPASELSRFGVPSTRKRRYRVSRKATKYNTRLGNLALLARHDRFDEDIVIGGDPVAKDEMYACPSTPDPADEAESRIMAEKVRAWAVRRWGRRRVDNLMAFLNKDKAHFGLTDQVWANNSYAWRSARENAEGMLAELRAKFA